MPLCPSQVLSCNACEHYRLSVVYSDKHSAPKLNYYCLIGMPMLSYSLSLLVRLLLSQAALTVNLAR